MSLLNFISIIHDKKVLRSRVFIKWVEGIDGPLYKNEGWSPQV